MINETLNCFNTLLVNKAKKCMKFIPTKRPGRKKEKGKNWYNSECIGMKKRLQNLARLLLKHPKDPFIRGQYFKFKKAYRWTVKARKSNFEKQAIDTLQSLSANPKEFWAFLRKLGGGQHRVNTPLSSEVWANHFSTLSQNETPLQNM